MRSYFIAVLFAVGCGGGGGKPNLVDAPPPDVEQFTCGLPASLGSGTIGSAAQPVNVMAQKLTMGTAAGSLAFGIVATINMPGQRTQGIFLIAINGHGTYAAAGAEGLFTGPPKLNVANAALNVGSTAPTECGACIEGYSDYTESGTTVMLGTAKQGFFNVDKTGTLSITAWAPAAAPSAVSTIEMSYNNVTLKGADLVAMMDTTCVTAITKVTLTNMKVTWPAMLLTDDPPKNTDGPFGMDTTKMPVLPIQFDQL